jgi:CO/xanthine dehydrogenase FAD-binding subunit
MQWQHFPEPGEAGSPAVLQQLQQLANASSVARACPLVQNHGQATIVATSTTLIKRFNIRLAHFNYIIHH